VSWFIDESSRAAIHIGGFVVTFDDAGFADKIIAPKPIEAWVVDRLIQDGSIAWGRAHGARELLPMPRPSTRRDLSLREASSEFVKLLERRPWRWILGRRRRMALQDLQHAVELATEHGIFEMQALPQGPPNALVSSIGSVRLR